MRGANKHLQDTLSIIVYSIQAEGHAIIQFTRETHKFDSLAIGSASDKHDII